MIIMRCISPKYAQISPIKYVLLLNVREDEGKKKKERIRSVVVVKDERPRKGVLMGPFGTS